MFYRGQERDYSLIPSLYRSVNNEVEALNIEQKLDDALEMLRPHFDPRGTDDESKALC